MNNELIPTSSVFTIILSFCLLKSKFAKIHKHNKIDFDLFSLEEIKNRKDVQIQQNSI